MGYSKCRSCGYTTGIESSHPADHTPEWERCTCGSGGHPRRCTAHPAAFDQHVFMLDEKNNWVDEVEALDRAGNHSKASFRLFDETDMLFLKGEFDHANKLLECVEVSQWSTTLLVSWMSATLCVKDKLPHRPALFQRIKEEITRRDSHIKRLEERLEGLE